MASPRSYYEILNVAPGAEVVVIDAAYRALMKKYHPDQGGGAADGPSAAEINRAYAVLRDPERRADYDHKEWVRQRDIQLASYQPPPPRRSYFFGWSGWLVSLALAGMIGLMASKGGDSALNEAEQARLASVPPDLRSQPTSAGQPVVTPAETAEIRAAALAARRPEEEVKKPPAPPPAVEVTAPEPAPPPAAAAPPPAASAAAHRPAYAHRSSVPHRRKTAVTGRHDKDFLERQGYIY
jgi:hypothetical protein